MKLKQYSGVADTFGRYWNIYGGWRALRNSPYLHFSILLSILLWPLWSDCQQELYGLVVTIVPSVFGFSLGGYAILLAFGDDKFRRVITGPDEDGTPSPFMEVNAAFIHFIVVSACALVLGVIGHAWNAGWFAALICCINLIYSIACALASAFAIFEVSGWFDAHTEIENENESHK